MNSKIKNQINKVKTECHELGTMLEDGHDCPMEPKYIHQSQIIKTNGDNKLIQHVTFKRSHRKIGRNEVCPYCNSGEKYKRCHGALLKVSG